MVGSYHASASTRIGALGIIGLGSLSRGWVLRIMGFDEDELSDSCAIIGIASAIKAMMRVKFFFICLVFLVVFDGAKLLL